MRQCNEKISLLDTREPAANYEALTLVDRRVFRGIVQPMSFVLAYYQAQILIVSLGSVDRLKVPPGEPASNGPWLLPSPLERKTTRYQIWKETQFYLTDVPIFLYYEH